MSKGSGRRPREITAAQEAENWQRTFGEKPKPLNDEPPSFPKE